MNQKQLTYRELATFCDQTAMILKSGISISEGLDIMACDAQTDDGKQILLLASSCMNKGDRLSEALKNCIVFPQYMIDMTFIGETTGHLDDVMDSLSKFYAKEDSTNNNIRSAIRYPLIMITMMVIVILVLMIKVLPVFNQVFMQLGSEITGITKGIMNTGAMISRYSLIFVGIIAVVAIFSVYCLKTQHGKKLAKKICNNFFVTKNLFKQIAASRFADGMSMTLSSGLDTEKSLEMVERLVDHPEYIKKIQHCKELVADGENLGDALVHSQIFSGMYGRMVSMGFKTGNADEIMNKISIEYAEEIEDSINEKVSLIEPTLVSVFSIIVGFILLSVMLPLMGIMSSIG
ncbi:MAG: type II secretion system F family protein [Oscillospiraceae bacterium]